MLHSQEQCSQELCPTSSQECSIRTPLRPPHTAYDFRRWDSKRSHAAPEKVSTSDKTCSFHIATYTIPIEPHYLACSFLPLLPHVGCLPGGNQSSVAPRLHRSIKILLLSFQIRLNLYVAATTYYILGVRAG